MAHEKRKLPPVDAIEVPAWSEVRRTMQAIEDHMGGRRQPDPHEVQNLPMTGEKLRLTTRVGCGMRSRVTIPYETPKGKPSFGTFCVICDRVDQFPKVREALGR